MSIQKCLLDNSSRMIKAMSTGKSGSSDTNKTAPTEAPDFDEEFQATDPSKHCMQYTPDGIAGIEDCLVLNIYTKNITGHQPIIVWIDGEDYSNVPDSSVYTFNKLLNHNVVIVSINYRLSVFGFLCLGVEEAPGNAGLKDIIAGLNWIFENIGQFGGDPNNVMLFGHGSGAAMVDLVTLSPMSKGLVHKVIAASGTSLAPWAVAHQPVKHALKLAQKLGFDPGSGHTDIEKKIGRFLIKLEASDIAEALSDFRIRKDTPPFAPCIENQKIKPTFISKAPIDIIRSGEYQQIPYITGYTNMEGTMITKTEFTRDKKEARIQLPADLSNETAIAPSVNELYFGPTRNLSNSIEYIGDVMIVISTIRTAEERVQTSKEPVRLYEFSYRGTKHSNLRNLGTNVTGAHHRSILNYLFDYDMTEFDDYAQEALIGRWIGFAYNGNPVNTSTSQVTWEPLTRDQLNYLLIKGDREALMHTFQEIVSLDPQAEKYKFWKKLYLRNYKKPLSFNGSDKGNCLSVILLALTLLTVRFI